MRVAFHTLGCKLNSTETAAIQRQFIAKGHSVVEYGSEADLLLINTCTVTEQADVECRKVVRRGLRSAPEASVIVTGCYAQLQPEEIASIEGVTAVVGTADKMSIADCVDEYLSKDTVTIRVRDVHEASFVTARSGSGNSRTRAFLKVQDGCDYSCTFCTIPLARGPARAMSIADIRIELSAIASERYHECVLTGINLGEYRSAQGERFVDILKLATSMDLKYRMRIGSIEPNTLTNEVLAVWKESKLFVPHLHMPLQSGSDRILRSMKRRYNTSMYTDRVQAFHSLFPDAGIGIDVIAGYPGETQECFEQTVEYLQSIPWTYLHVFTYSERENTPAAYVESKVPMAVRRERTNLLRVMSTERTNAFHTSQLGSRKVFIPEALDVDTESWHGWTENHVAVTMNGNFTMQKRPYHVMLHSVIGQKVLAFECGDEL